jgi:hypothetical protein
VNRHGEIREFLMSRRAWVIARTPKAPRIGVAAQLSNPGSVASAIAPPPNGPSS